MRGSGVSGLAVAQAAARAGPPSHFPDWRFMRLQHGDHSEGGNAVANRAETTITLTDAPHDDELNEPISKTL